jgi:hypothetical protein
MIGEGPQQDRHQALPVTARRSGQVLGDPGEFVPTERQQRVLEVITAPEHRTTDNKAKAAALGMSERQFYRIMAEPGFQEYRRNLMAVRVGAQVESFIHAAAQTARIIGREGDNARRLLMTLSGDHRERTHHEHDHRHRVLVGVVGVPLEELEGKSAG